MKKISTVILNLIFISVGFCEILIDDSLTDSQTLLGAQAGGTWISGEGWQQSTGHDQIVYDLGRAYTEGAVVFNTRGFYDSLSGSSSDKIYFFGIYSNSSGDKNKSYTGAKFIEVRYNGIFNEDDDGLNHHGEVKTQVGWQGTPNIVNVFSDVLEWGGKETTYRWTVKWGGGKVIAWRNDIKIAEISNTDELEMTHIFLGDVNYKGEGNYYTGPVGVIFSNVLVTDGDIPTPIQINSAKSGNYQTSHTRLVFESNFGRMVIPGKSDAEGVLDIKGRRIRSVFNSKSSVW
ncbi:MAG: hypothetical protein HQK83_02420 [Fibrobacteria bacterium]|nr:hypothetical protein [Fibrobacteria bacterium]